MILKNKFNRRQKSGRAALLIGMGLSLAWSPFVSADAPKIPQTKTAQDYRRIWETNPFVIPVVSDGNENSRWAANLTLTGWLKDWITVEDKSSNRHFIIAVEPDANPEGITLVSIDKSEGMENAYATIQRGSETARIRFNPSQFQNPNAAAMMMPPSDEDEEPPPSYYPPPGLNPSAQDPQRSRLRLPRRRIIPSQPAQNPNM